MQVSLGVYAQVSEEVDIWIYSQRTQGGIPPIVATEGLRDRQCNFFSVISQTRVIDRPFLCTVFLFPILH